MKTFWPKGPLWRLANFKRGKYKLSLPPKMWNSPRRSPLNKSNWVYALCSRGFTSREGVPSSCKFKKSAWRICSQSKSRCSFDLRNLRDGENLRTLKAREGGRRKGSLSPSSREVNASNVEYWTIQGRQSHEFWRAYRLFVERGYKLY